MPVFDGDGSDNTLSGGLAADTITGAGGNDSIDGGQGIDVAVFGGNASGYSFGYSNGQLTVTDINLANGDDGTDVLSGIEVLRFADRDYTSPPVGEFRVNTTTADSQKRPVIATLTDGSYVVVWDSNTQDLSGRGVYAQRYDANGNATGIEFRVNFSTTGHQDHATVAALDGGGFVVAWQGQDAVSEGVYARRFDATGTAVDTNDIAVNTTTAGGQYEPSVSGISGGGFVVNWYSDDQDGPGFAPIGRVFFADGTPPTAEFLLTTAADEQFDPSVAKLGTGFVAVWASYSQDGGVNGQTGVYGRIFDSTGAATVTEFHVNITTADYQDSATVCVLKNGGFVVAWRSAGQDNADGSDGVYARIFDASGAPVDETTEIAVNQTTLGEQRLASITALTGGGFVVTWMSEGQDGPGDGVYARVFGADGVPAPGGEFVVNTTTSGNQTLASVSALSDGGFMVVWQSDAATGGDGSSEGIYAQRFDASGHELLTRIVGTAASDTIDLTAAGNLAALGGAGNDIYVVSGTGDKIIELAAQGKDLVRSGASYTLGANLEKLTLTGSANVNGTGNASANTITGNSGNNKLLGSGGNDVLVGGGGVDTLNGGNGKDTLRGGAGDDRYTVGTGDVISESLNQGYDRVSSSVSYTLSANVESLTLTGTGLIDATGNGGDNALTGNGAKNKLTGSGGNDSLSGGGGTDSLLGGGGNDTLNGGNGIDTLQGGDGNDLYIAGSGDKHLESAGGGIDTVRSGISWTLAAFTDNLELTGAVAIDGTGNGEANVITGNTFANTLKGGAGADTISGSSGVDLIVGGTDADTLNGDGGNDTLQGSTGNDVLTGGTGSDQFVFDSALNASTNVDVITDFAHLTDKIVLDDDVFKAFNAAVSTTILDDNLVQVQGAGVPSAQDAEDRLIYNSTDGKLYYDADGTGGASNPVLFAQLGTTTHPATLSAADFLIVG